MTDCLGRSWGSAWTKAAGYYSRNKKCWVLEAGEASDAFAALTVNRIGFLIVDNNLDIIQIKRKAATPAAFPHSSIIQLFPGRRDLHFGFS